MLKYVTFSKIKAEVVRTFYVLDNSNHQIINLLKNCAKCKSNFVLVLDFFRPVLLSDTFSPYRFRCLIQTVRSFTEYDALFQMKQHRQLKLLQLQQLQL